MHQKNKINIACLPVAGTSDPTQFLMIQGLNESAYIHAFNGKNDRFFGIIRSAIKYKPDFIHFDWIESYYLRRNIILTYLNLPLFFSQILICKYVFRIKLAWTIHNILPHDRKNIKIKYFVLRYFGKIVNFIRVLSPQTVEFYSSKFKIDKSKIHFIGLGDYTDYYPNSVSRIEARRILQIPDNAKVLLTLGSIKPYKGIPEYLKIIKEINNTDLYILIAGKCLDTTLEKEIKAFKDNRIHFENKFIENDQLQFYYNAADLLILPFLEIENSGSVVMAMGFKKAVVAPQSNVINDRLKYQPQLLFKHDTLSETIINAINSSAVSLQKYGENNYRQLKEYSWADFEKLFIQYADKRSKYIAESLNQVDQP